MREKNYLDTSIPSAYLDERDQSRQKITQRWWNETKRKVRAINLLQGYREIEIESPLELGGVRYA